MARVKIDKFPCLARITPALFRIGYSILVPTKDLRKADYYKMKMPIVYVLGIGYGDEFLIIPLELLIDKTISLKTLTRWTKAKRAKDYLPYIYNRDKYLSLDLIGE